MSVFKVDTRCNTIFHRKDAKAQSINKYIFSFVNTTSGPVRPLRNLLPVYDLSVQLNLEGKLSSYKVLQSQGEVKVTSAKGKIDVKLSKLEDFFAVHLIMG
jgi:hypothetical protein